ncbi:MAG: metal-sensing transcriptional repressor [Ruminococcaceae bacterium]|nr:metal-sensing transcriptional repressor [Oscillospiraceae bacterium]
MECKHKIKVRSEEELTALVHRLNRMEGQIKGIKGMLENNAYCEDILIQVSAVNAALNSFNKELLSNHINTCIKDAVMSDDKETIDKFIATLGKLMK